MKTKVSPAVIGMFVLGAMILGIFALISIGGVNFFSRPQRFQVNFDETVHGLDLGSPVKLRGVRVGRVASINLHYKPNSSESVVAVICELNRDVLADEKGLPIDVSDRAQLEQLIARGLRAQLGVIGLATGLLYVELDFFDPAEYPVPPPSTVNTRYAHVPAVPSTISEFQASLSEILTNLKGIDFVGLSRELNGLLADTRRQINTLDVKELLAQWTAAGASVQALASSPEIGATITNLNGAVTDLRSVLARLDGQIDPTATNINTTLDEMRESLVAFDQLARTLRAFINSQQNLGDGANQAFSRLGEAAEAVQRLADFLERNPSALLSGRRAPTETPDSR
ncbi:MlaD family protein [Opitutaceae bacterium]